MHSGLLRAPFVYYYIIYIYCITIHYFFRDFIFLSRLSTIFLFISYNLVNLSIMYFSTFFKRLNFLLKNLFLGFLALSLDQAKCNLFIKLILQYI